MSAWLLSAVALLGTGFHGLAEPGGFQNVMRVAAATLALILITVLALYGTRAATALRAYRSTTSGDAPHGAAYPFEIDRLAHFAESLIGADDHHALRQVLRSSLPTLLGSNDIWLLTEESGWRDEIGAVDDAAPALSDASAWQSFILTTSGKRTGVLGVKVASLSVAPEQRRIINIVCRLISASIERVRYNEEIRELSTVDPLTGCLLRHSALQRLTAELGRAQRSGQPLTVIAVSLGNLSDIRTRHRPDCAPRVIMTVARTLEKTFRASDVRCRLSETEFLVVLPETPMPGATRAAAHLVKSIAETDFRCSGDSVAVAVRTGLAEAQGQEQDAQRIVDRAFSALDSYDLRAEPPRDNSASPRGPRASTNSATQRESVAASAADRRAHERRSAPIGGRRASDVPPRPH